MLKFARNKQNKKKIAAQGSGWVSAALPSSNLDQSDAISDQFLQDFTQDQKLYIIKEFYPRLQS